MEYMKSKVQAGETAEMYRARSQHAQSHKEGLCNPAQEEYAVNGKDWSVAAHLYNSSTKRQNGFLR